MASANRRKANDRTDITLMTLLANEATGHSRKILKKYKQPDAKNHKDLEVKLAELYFKADDKIALEKELAEIHPHRKWLMKYIEPTIVEKEVVKEITIPAEIKSNADGNCPNCSTNKTSSFDGATPSFNSVMGIMGIIAVVGIVSLSIIHVTKK
jgi:hypothetical protein